MSLGFLSDIPILSGLWYYWLYWYKPWV